jgi:hypothetical protein
MNLTEDGATSPQERLGRLIVAPPDVGSETLLTRDPLAAAALTHGAARLDVHRGGYHARLTERLARSLLARVVQVVGDATTVGLLRDFFAWRAPRADVLPQTLAGLDVFAATHPSRDAHPYLADLVAAALARWRVLTDVDPPPRDPTLTLERARLAPAHAYVPSAWPLYDLWRLGDEGATLEASGIALVPRGLFFFKSDPVTLEAVAVDAAVAPLFAALAAGASVRDAIATWSADPAAADATDDELFALITSLTARGAFARREAT